MAGKQELSWATPLPPINQLRWRIERLLDRRNLSLRKATRLVCRAPGPPEKLSPSTLTRFLAGGDIGYTALVKLWNVLIDAQPISGSSPITEAMIPKRRIEWASDEMTAEDVQTRLHSLDIDYAPWHSKDGKCIGILDVKTAVTAFSPARRTLKTLREAGIGFHPEAPKSYQATDSVRVVENDLRRGLESDPFRALAFVRDGREILGLVVPYNLSNILD